MSCAPVKRTLMIRNVAISNVCCQANRSHPMTSNPQNEATTTPTSAIATRANLARISPWTKTRAIEVNSWLKPRRGEDRRYVQASMSRPTPWVFRGRPVPFETRNATPTAAMLNEVRLRGNESRKYELRCLLLNDWCRA